LHNTFAFIAKALPGQNRSTIFIEHLLRVRTYGESETQLTPTQRKFGFVAALTLVGCALLGIRVYEVDLPLWHFLGFGQGPDPATLHLHGEFVESNLGLSQEASGALTMRMIAQQYLFTPQCIEVPAGSPVNFRITSADAVHLLSLGDDANYSLKAVPGVVTKATFTFPNPGIFKIPCREFCGAGHYEMRGQLRVVPRDQFASLKPGERRVCGPK
jgi:cytochrome c oxidase subunit 2